jgi:Tol biopolymer transport system component
MAAGWPSRGISENTSDVWLIDADGANAQRLTTHPSEEVQPGWSQDGKRVLFGAYREEHGAGLWSIDIESGEESFVFPHVRHRTGPQLSPD